MLFWRLSVQAERAADEAVMIETAMIAGGKVIERFELEEETDRLTVTVRLQQRARGPWLEFVRYFERRE